MNREAHQQRPHVSAHQSLLIIHAALHLPHPLCAGIQAIQDRAVGCRCIAICSFQSMLQHVTQQPGVQLMQHHQGSPMEASLTTRWPSDAAGQWQQSSMQCCATGRHCILLLQVGVHYQPAACRSSHCQAEHHCSSVGTPAQPTRPCQDHELTR